MNEKNNKKMSNHIEEYFAQIEGTKESLISRELFKADSENIELKTHLTDEEIILINTLFFNNSILVNAGLKPVYSNWLEKYMRLKVSKDRLSRQEFVQINKQQFDDFKKVSDLSNIKNIMDTKK